MLSFSDLKPGTSFIVDGDPYVVLEYHFLRMQQRRPVAQTKIRNLRTGKTMQKTFHSSETFKEAVIEKKPIIYIYNSKGQYWFHKKGNPSERFSIDETILKDTSLFLKENSEIIANNFKGNIINVSIPIKIDLKVKETPPGNKGDSAQGGTKEAVLETGFKLQVPLFINEGDIIRINTDSKEYTERVEKS